MKGHTEIKTRQVKGSNCCGEGEVPVIEKTPSCEATFYDEAARGDAKFDNDGPDVLGQGKMEEEHTSGTR